MNSDWSTIWQLLEISMQASSKPVFIQMVILTFTMSELLSFWLIAPKSSGKAVFRLSTMKTEKIKFLNFSIHPELVYWIHQSHWSQDVKWNYLLIALMFNSGSFRKTLTSSNCLENCLWQTYTVRRGTFLRQFYVQNSNLFKKMTSTIDTMNVPCI